MVDRSVWGRDYAGSIPVTPTCFCDRSLGVRRFVANENLASSILAGRSTFLFASSSRWCRQRAVQPHEVRFCVGCKRASVLPGVSCLPARRPSAVRDRISGIRGTGLHFDGKSKALKTALCLALAKEHKAVLTSKLGSTPRVPT